MATENDFRYRECYVAARIALSISKILRNLAGALFLVGLVVCYLVFMSNYPNLFGGLLWAICAAASVYISGVVVEVLGRILQMVTDIAIHGAPHLTDKEKAKIVARN